MSELNRAVVVLALLGVAGGCGDQGGVSVSGKVAFAKQPVEGGIYFFPEPEGSPIVAALDGSGKYSITLPPGNYKVIVNKKDPPPQAWKEGDPPPVSANPLPAKYSEPAVTELKAAVSDRQSEPINFDLE